MPGFWGVNCAGGGGGGFRPPLRYPNWQMLESWTYHGGSPLCYEHFGIEIILLMSALFAYVSILKYWFWKSKFSSKKNIFNNGRKWLYGGKFFFAKVTPKRVWFRTKNAENFLKFFCTKYLIETLKVTKYQHHIFPAPSWIGLKCYFLVYGKKDRDVGRHVDFVPRVSFFVGRKEQKLNIMFGLWLRLSLTSFRHPSLKAGSFIPTDAPVASVRNPLHLYTTEVATTLEISIERSPQHWCPSVVSNSQPLDPELGALDHSATAPQLKDYLQIIYRLFAFCRVDSAIVGNVCENIKDMLCDTYFARQRNGNMVTHGEILSLFRNYFFIFLFFYNPRFTRATQITKIKNTNTGTKTNTVRENTKQQITGSTHAKHLGDISKSATRRYGYKHTDTNSVRGGMDFSLVKRAVKTLWIDDEINYTGKNFFIGGEIKFVIAQEEYLN